MKNEQPRILIYATASAVVLEAIGVLGALYNLNFLISNLDHALVYAAYFGGFCWSVLFLGFGMLLHLVSQGVGLLHYMATRPDAKATAQVQASPSSRSAVR